MKSKSKETKHAAAERGLIGRVALLVCAMVAAAYPYVLAFYGACFALSRFSRAWQVFFDRPALSASMAFFTLAAVIGWRGRERASDRSLYLKTLLSILILAAALIIGIEPFNLLILLFGLAVVVYRRIDPKFALAAAILTLIAVPILEASGQESLSAAAAIGALCLFCVLLASALTDSKKLPPQDV